MRRSSGGFRWAMIITERTAVVRYTIQTRPASRLLGPVVVSDGKAAPPWVLRFPPLTAVHDLGKRGVGQTAGASPQRRGSTGNNLVQSCTCCI
jgi:hypothetical protein